MYQLRHLKRESFRMRPGMWAGERRDGNGAHAPRCGTLEKKETILTANGKESTGLGKEIHAWEAGGAASAKALAGWVSARLEAHEASLAALLAVEGKRMPEKTLVLYDRAIEQLNLAGAQAGVLNSVAADKAVRDQAQDEAQRVAMAGSKLSLNRPVYEALAAIDLEGASPATRHYVERTLLGYRLAGVDRDQATRDRLQALQERATMLSLEFGRNIQEWMKTVEATVEELDGLPEDYIARHQPGADGKITLTTDQPDMQPVMPFAVRATLLCDRWEETLTRVRHTMARDRRLAWQWDAPNTAAELNADTDVQPPPSQPVAAQQSTAVAA